MDHHNKLGDGFAHLASKAFTPAHVRDDPKVFTGRAMRGGKDKSKVKETLPKDEGDMNGDILIQYIWIQGTNSINNMCVVNNDAITHQPPNPEKCLDNDER